jgi:hypothetical protein
MSVFHLVDKSTGKTHEVPYHDLNEAMQGGLVFPSIDEKNRALEYHAKQDQGFFTKLPGNLAAGLMEGGRGIVNAPHQIANAIKPEWGNRIGNAVNPETNYSEKLGLPEEQTLSDKLIQGAMQFAPSLLAPELSLGKAGKAIESIPKVGKYLKSMIGNAIPQGAYNATQSDNPGEAGLEAAAVSTPFSALSVLAKSANPWARKLARAGTAAVSAYLGHEAAKAAGANGWGANAAGAVAGALGHTVGYNPKLDARKKVLAGVEGSNYKEKLAASNRLGLTHLTPAEASGNPFTAAKQGAVGRTHEGAKMMYERGQERVASEEKAINKLLDTAYNPALHDSKVKSLYESAYKKEVPSASLTDLTDNKVMQRAERLVKNKPAYQESLKDVPTNSVAYLDHVKKALDDMIEKAPMAEGRILKQTRSELLEKMDAVSPEYKEARQLAERGIVRKDIEKMFNAKEMKGTNFYNALKNSKTYSEIKHHLRNVPEAQHQLKDMKMIFGDLINPPSVRTAAGQAKTSMTSHRNSADVWIDKAREFLTNGKFDKEAVELITNPNWADELHKINELTGYEKKISAAMKLFGNAAAASNTKQKNKPMEIEVIKRIK